MDVWPEDGALLNRPRRRMRRPVAGGLPYASEPLPILEDQIEVPAWVWVSVGAGIMAVAITVAAATALSIWFERTFGKL